MHQLGLLFAGQGAQSSTMGQSFLTHPFFQHELQQMNTLLGYDLMELITLNDGRLNQTLFTQPSIFSISTLIWQVLQSTSRVRVSATCGFSLGEYAALGASGAFSIESLVRLILVRANAMHQASIQQPGKMAAILGLDDEKVIQICNEASTAQDIVIAANFNSPGQVVISGHVSAIERAVQLANQRGARRAIVLNVSGAFHSPLMASAQPLLQDAIAKEELKTISIPIYMNVDATVTELSLIAQKMVNQLVQPVQFERTIRHMIRDGITHFLEIGPGTVLQGLVKKIVPDIPVMSLNEWSELETVKGWLKQYEFIK